MNKLKNAVTVNIDDDARKIIDYLSSYYQRKPAELLRLLLIPVLLNEFATIQNIEHPENKKNWIKL